MSLDQWSIPSVLAQNMMDNTSAVDAYSSVMESLDTISNSTTVPSKIREYASKCRTYLAEPAQRSAFVRDHEDATDGGRNRVTRRRVIDAGPQLGYALVQRGVDAVAESPSRVTKNSQGTAYEYPNRLDGPSPHKPKVRTADIGALRGTIALAMSSAKPADVPEAVLKEMWEAQVEQRQLASLSKFPHVQRLVHQFVTEERLDGPQWL
ncbi:hypothetical protein BC832DRAFT_619112 [Gaertneriomyces semiglobifer]|nr:hypothetical protein BC832DRAFT_619112 [Gaertneriomyces semiglobifer]